MESTFADLSSELDSADNKDVVVYSISLVDPNTGLTVFNLENGAKIDISGISGQIMVRADTSAQTQSVGFTLNSQSALDNSYPFEFSFDAIEGHYSLAATGFKETGMRGTSHSMTVTFTLVDSSSDLPEEPKLEEPKPEEPPEVPKPEEPKPEEPKPEVPVVGTYYVSPRGSDSNSGSMSKPFKTLQKAVSVVAPGDIVVVKDGVYKDSTNSDYGLLINKAGTSSKWIRIVSENRYGAIIDGDNNKIHYGVSFGKDAKYISVEGFQIRGYVDGGFFSNAGAQYINMYGNLIYNIGRRCTDSDYGQSGIYIGTTARYHTIDSNIIHTIGRFAPGENGCKPATENWKNHDHGIYIKGSNVDIVNNVFNHMKRGWAIHAYAADIANVRVINNTFYGANPDRVGHILMTGSGRMFTNWLIQNNIFEDPNGKALSFACERVSGLKVYGNITTHTMVTGDTCFDSKSNKEGASAQMRAPASSDFKITSSSKACEVALTANSPEIDIDGVQRPTGSVCAGAYQPR